MSRKTLGLSFALFSILAAGVLAPAAHAQVLYGSLTGNVTDPSGAAVPNVKVEALNTNTGVSRTATTDDGGSYSFNDLQPGLFKITYSAPSFRTVVQENVQILANNLRRLDTQLSVAQVSEAITVSGSAIALQTDRADVNSEIPRTQIANLPFTGNAGRNWQALYKIIPGFSPPAELHSDAGNPQRALGSNVNGSSYSNNNTRLDGATVSYPWLPHIVAYVPPADAVETVNIVSNSFDAEQGMAGGSAINVAIKSGTNDYHGSTHWFHTNSAMRARNFFNATNGIPKNILNQGGFTFGGPILKNKLFFFTDWERTVRREFRSVFQTVPTEAMRRGDFSSLPVSTAIAQIYDPTTGAANGAGRQLFPGQIIPTSRIDLAANRMNALLPAPNQTTYPNNYFAAGSYQFNRDNFDLKVNYNPTDKSSMFARYSISPSDIFDPPALGPAGGNAIAGGQPGTSPGRIQSASVGGTYTITPRLLADATLGFTRQRLGSINVDIDKNYGLDDLQIPGTNGADRLQGGYPRFNVSNISAFGNPNVSNPFLFRDNQWVVGGNLSYIRGVHNFRFGGEYTYYTINHFQPQAAFGPRGGFNLTGGVTSLQGGPAPGQFNGYADFLLGLPNAMGKDVQYINPAAVRMPGWGFYARDQWQVTRKLTVNFGARFERYPFATRDHRGGERYDPETNLVLIGGLGNTPTDTGVNVPTLQVAPRLGIAYRVDDKTVIRAGYGISIDPDSFRRMRDSYPATVSSQFNAPSTLQAAGSFRTGIPAVVVPDLNTGAITIPNAVGTVTWPTEYRRGYFQSWNFTIQRDLGWGFNLQSSYVGTRAIRQTAILNLNYSEPGRGTSTGRVLGQRWGRTADVNMYTPFNTSNYNGFQNQLRRQFAGGGMVGVAYTWSKAISFADNNDSGLSWHQPSLWGRNRAPAGFDRTHNFQMYGVYTLPFGKGQRYANSGITGHVIGNWQINGIFSKYTGTPFTVGSAGTSLNAAGAAQTADQVKPVVEILGGVGRGNSWFDPTAFMPVTEVRFGTTGRNILRGPGLTNLDASLFRDFFLTERFKLQFRAEAFNISNTPAFNNPGATVSSASRNAAGQITNLGGYTEITGAQNTERQFRFALKLMF
ncbi:MAG: TonB-dependent receptor [Acidobacteria bacterium]|nr:TonB-dependent receptor [Acidobacteriota bacterium]